MKIAVHLHRILGAVSLLVFAFSITASQALAGPSPQVGQQTRNSRAKTAEKAQAAEPADDSVMKCPACKTVTLREPVYMQRETTEIDSYGYVWIDVGAKHTCARCGGALTIMKGAATGSMSQPCAMCGKDAALCSATIRAAAPRT